LISIGFLAISGSAHAATYLATSANFASVFYAAKAGDRIVASGNFGTMLLRDRSFSTPITIDATNARFTDTLMLKQVSGVNFTAGTFGSATGPTRSNQAVIITGGSFINFNAPTVVGNGFGQGLMFNGTSNVGVRNGTFTSLGRGMAFTSVTNGVIDRNRFLASSSDGIAIVDSHFVTATNNNCSGTVPAPGAHPDCIQMWSLSGRPVQSDIVIADNTATGSTQGFTSFDPGRGGGLRISFLRNRVDTNYPQGIACYACVDSLIADNVLTSMADARWITTINVVGGRNNILRNNSIGPLGGAGGSSRSSMSTFDDVTGIASMAAVVPGGFARLATSAFGEDNLDFSNWLTADDLALGSAASAVTGVPEPTVWLQLLAGMAAIGMALRRRRPQAA
jgi:hypothetical protein